MLLCGLCVACVGYITAAEDIMERFLRPPAPCQVCCLAISTSSSNQVTVEELFLNLCTPQGTPTCLYVCMYVSTVPGRDLLQYMHLFIDSFIVIILADYSVHVRTYTRNIVLPKQRATALILT